MLALIQLVSEAQVTVNEKKVAEIGRGILLLLGVQKNDHEQQIDRLLQKIQYPAPSNI